jgi:hypothetical protein
MNTWIRKLKTSMSLDRPSPGPPKPADPAVDATDPIRQVDAALKAPRHEAAIPPTLHDDIMRAVRQSAAAPERPRTPVLARHWALAAASIVILTVLWSGYLVGERMLHQSRQTQNIAAAEAILGLNTSLTERSFDMAMQPLADEIQRLNSDGRAIKDMIAATLPVEIF